MIGAGAASLAMTISLSGPAEDGSAQQPMTGLTTIQSPDQDAGHHHEHGSATAQPDGAASHVTLHEDAEGLKLVATAGEPTRTSENCPAAAPRRPYDVVALAVDVTLNRYLDHDPQGRMYALASEVAAIRAEERANAAARAGTGDPAVSLGLQGDAIQPLTLRVLPGECLVVRLENLLVDEPVSFHLHGAVARLVATGAPATAANPDATAAPDGVVSYAWMVPEDEPEGTHYFHSHGNQRAQTSHGLFGALIVEPPGSTWTDPLTGEPIETGWQAIVHPADGPAFREFVLYYHEIGHENERLRDGQDRLLAVVDPITSAYRPAARALNYRSEPFMHRLALQQDQGAVADKSLAYSSYAFGDPATPVLRAYLGDPVKQRVLHGGSEVFHVHHVHGGTTRWPRQPGTEGAVFAQGLDKGLPMTPETSERTDSQSLGPSETFDIEMECASGGCQQGAGDYMFHCHVAHHYFAGMWGIVRTYNTLQDGSASTDGLAPLHPMPTDPTPESAVTSDALVGTTIEAASGTTMITADSLTELVESQLPPSGVPAEGDASTFDWVRVGDRFLSEPETRLTWPGYASDTPGERPPLLFDPRTGRLAYPMLRPHLGQRPPFAPGHGPAPYLDPKGNGRDPPAPGSSGLSSVCPDGTRQREFAINAIRTPILISERGPILDPNGMLYVLRSQRDRVATERSLQVPLALRTNAGQDCVDVLLRSELRDDRATPFSKVGIHIHFVQFDVQGSDGVNLGFNYEQTVRPYAAEGATIGASVRAGGTRVPVDDAGRFRPGALVGVGMDLDEGFEVARIASIEGTTLVLEAPLRHDHTSGEYVSTEFVRYRWYPDVQFGTAYFHDHVDALKTWDHGLFGALVAEPPDAVWTDPDTGEPLASGPIADVHTSGSVGVDVQGSFRELLLFTQDGNHLTHLGRSTGGTFNLRAEPLKNRQGPPELVFSSNQHGDPETPLLRAHLGDPVVIRSLVGAANEVHTLHVDGHWFRAEPFSPTSPPVAAIDVGISERYDLVIPAAGGPQQRAGDYLYENGRPTKLVEGSWGLIRVLDPSDAGLIPLPGANPLPTSTEPVSDVCPAKAPVRRFEVIARNAPLPMHDDGAVFVTPDMDDAVASGRVTPEPLVLRATVGDCLEVVLTNRMRGSRVSFRTSLLARDPSSSAGVAAGMEPDQSVAPGENRTYRLYAHPEVGETVVLVRDGADAIRHPRRGLYGAIVIAASGTRFLDPDTGLECGSESSWRCDVIPVEGEPYRDAVLFLHDEDVSIGTHRMPYTEAVEGAAAVNYRREVLGGRSIAEAVAQGPSTPVIPAIAGDRVRIHVLAPWSEQAQVFAVEGHSWPQEPGLEGTPRLSSRRIAGLQALSLELDAGGREQLPGDYLYGNHRVPFEEAGVWGILRVSAGPTAGLRALPQPAGSRTEMGLALAAILAGLATSAAWRSRRRRARLQPVTILKMVPAMAQTYISPAASCPNPLTPR